jgi:hypothetical protein
MPRHRQNKVFEVDRIRGLALADDHVEAADAAIELDVEQPHVGLRIFPVSDHASIFDPADKLLHDRVIEAHHCEPVKRQVLDKSAKRFLDGIERLEMVEMLGIDVSDDRHVRRQF